MTQNNSQGNKIKNNPPKPFLKWAGGKTQLLDEIEKRLPVGLNEDTIYFEPFVGGGAVFFYLMKKYEFKHAYLNDINKDLILTYNIIKNRRNKLNSKLKDFCREYDESNDKKGLFYKKRDQFNESNKDIDVFSLSKKNILRAAQMIFLNKTCFNGLYRVNKSGNFNVPFANPKKPLIYDKKNIDAVSKALQNVELSVNDYAYFKDIVDENSFVYLDPPYKPIDGKKSFEGYTKEGFDDNDQENLANFCKYIGDIRGAKFLLSNSNPADNSIYNLYKDFNPIEISAKRFINSNGKKRGSVGELLIYNDYNLKGE